MSKTELIKQAINNYIDASLLNRLRKKIGYLHKQLLIKILIKTNSIRKTKVKIISGQEMSIVLPDNISSSLYLAGFFEDEETKGFSELIGLGHTFVDIGAHIGYYSVLASHLAGKDGKIFSIEPTPSTFEILKENTKNISDGIQLNIALYSKEGEMSLNDFGIRFMSLNSFNEARLKEKISGKKINVKVETLDNLVHKYQIKPDVIKIDAESAEIEILRGGRDTIANFQPSFFIEVGDFENVDQGSSVKIIDLITSYGYKAYEYKNGFYPHVKHHGIYPSMSLFFFHDSKINDVLIKK